MTSTHRDLPVPDEALRALRHDDVIDDLHAVLHPGPSHIDIDALDRLPGHVRAIASPVAAAVLSDLADQLTGLVDEQGADGTEKQAGKALGILWAAGWLRERAGEYE